MTKFRAPIAFLVSALAFAAAMTPAAAENNSHKQIDVLSYSWGTTFPNDLPTPPPSLAAPKPTPGAPAIVHKKRDISTPLIQQASPAAKLNALKAK